MQGLFIHNQRPRSKKQVKEAVLEDPSDIYIEATSMFGNEYDGPLSEMPDGSVTFVGPDPHTKRNFYGTIQKTGSKIKVS